MMKCRRRQATKPQKLKKIVNNRFFVFCWWKRKRWKWKRKRLKDNRFHIPATSLNLRESKHMISQCSLTPFSILAILIVHKSTGVIEPAVPIENALLLRQARATKHPGMAGMVPELTSGAPCPKIDVWCPVSRNGPRLSWNLLIVKVF